MNNEINDEIKEQKKKGRYRIDLVIIIGLFVFLVSFCAYMMNTTLDTVLNNENGSSIVTHDYTDSTSK